MPTARPPKIVNIEELTERQAARVPLLHYTDKQWKRASRGLEFGSRRRLPKAGLLLTAIPHPDDVQVVHAHCEPSGPWDECRVRAVLKPDGSVTMECQCRRGRDPTAPSGPIQQPPPCRLTLWPRFGCESVRCAGRCSLRAWRDPIGGLLRIGCVCER